MNTTNSNNTQLKHAHKIALITGGNSGIGLATALRLKQEGAQVIITARNQDSYQKAVAEFGSQLDVQKADVTQPHELDQLYSYIKNKYKKLDIVFANAGVALFRPTSDVDAALFDHQFNTNVKGLYFTVAKALPLMNASSAIILNSSVVNNKGVAGASVYAATKAAVKSFAKSWTAEIPPSQIRFNVLSPGPIETPIYGKLGLPEEQVKMFGEQMIANTPMHRFGSPDEMAKVVSFLASSDSSYICGADIYADGGMGQI
jgi:NAD(P)-dependent dehydrogenase (short-subunit alcohol dehydrogenase family)